MAGPVASVLLDIIPSKNILKEIEEIIQKISDKVNNDDFWIIDTGFINGTVKIKEGRPFGIKKKKIDLEFDYSKEEILWIKKYVNFNPVFDIGILAMCNREIDHRILGELTLYLAEKFNGLVDFGRQIKQFDNVEGKKWEVPYRTIDNEIEFYNITDVVFMKNWLENKNFRMIK